MVFSGEGVWLAAASADHAIKIWEVLTGKLRHTLYGHTEPASWVRFSGDGKWLVTASSDRTARVWDVVSTGAEYVAIGSHTGPVRSAVLGPSGDCVITSSVDGTVRSMPLDLLGIVLARKPRDLTPEERARIPVATVCIDADSDPESVAYSFLQLTRIGTPDCGTIPFLHVAPFFVRRTDKVLDVGAIRVTAIVLRQPSAPPNGSPSISGGSPPSSDSRRWWRGFRGSRP